MTGSIRRSAICSGIEAMRFLQNSQMVYINVHNNCCTTKTIEPDQRKDRGRINRTIREKDNVLATGIGYSTMSNRPYNNYYAVYRATFQARSVMSSAIEPCS
jgi:hypothetical protein